MAARRMISTRFFKDPDIMNLSSKDTQLILIGLILAADDEGREVAHAGLLGREMDYPADLMEVALQELAANDLLLLYQAGKHRYYQLTRVWREWQTLGGRTTPSRYPAPPVSGPSERDTLTEPSGKSRGNAGDFPDQLNQTEENQTEAEEEENHPRRRTQTDQPQNVLPFLNPHADDGKQKREMIALTQQVARILTLTATDALMRLVAEYEAIPGLSLPGEADAAREWIDDPRRNRQRKRMSLSFFRNWLKREKDAIDRRQILLQQAALATGTGGPTSSPPGAPPAGRRPPDLMCLADEDRRIARTKGDQR